MKKWYKKAIISSLVIGTSISIAIPLTIFNLNKENSSVLEFENNSSNNGNNNGNKITKGKDLTPSVSNFINGKLVSKSGPIVFWGDTIMSLDWFGSVRWEINLTDPNNDNFKQTIGSEKLHIFPKKGTQNNENETTEYGSDINRSWVNWDLDKDKDILWILSNIRSPRNGNWGNDNGGFANQDWKRQWVVGINVKDGKFYARARTTRIQGRNDIYRNLSILSNGDPTPYGISFPINNAYGGGGKSYNFLYERFKVKENIDNNMAIMEQIRSVETSKLFKERNQENSDATDFMFNIIPLANNVNLVLTVQKSSMRNTNSGNTSGPWSDSNDSGVNQGDFGNVKERTMDVYGTLVDDKLNIINNSSPWNKPYLIIKNEDTRIRNKWVTPQRDWYKLLDGRIVTVIYDYLVIIDSVLNPHEPKISVKKLDDINNQWVESWSFDTDESLYVKGHGAKKIQKVVLDKNKNGTNHIISDYINLSNVSNKDVQDAAESTSIYNVPGYAGQVMGIKTYTHSKFTDNLPDMTNNETTTKYGLSLAITKNENTDDGDLKGLLNTDQAFQKSVDFEVKSDSLDNKLPSEISREDINVLNKGFLTENKDINDNGELLYPPIIKTNVEDENEKSLEITVHVDQIPWFVSNGKMPDDIKPTKMTKTYGKNDFKTDINKRFTWKSIETDYDFKNTLPSRLDLSYVEKLNPLVSSLESQRAIINSISYPNTKYEISNIDDDKGEVTIKAEYNYLPMEQKIVQNNIKKHIISETFKMFKSTENANFAFVGTNNITDISQIPELKELKESEILPSYFNSINDKQEFLKFIDVNKTRGYPLEKIDIKASGNDSNGTLRIDVDTSRYNNKKNTQTTFTKEFTGLNKNNTYKMSFKEPDSSKFDKKTLLPSEISEKLIYKHFVHYEGFNAKDFIVSTLPNDVNGELSVSLRLNNNFPESTLEKDTEFVKQSDGTFLAFKKFSGFKTNEIFNSEYQIAFKDLSKLDINLDKDLIELMKLTPSYIQTKMNDGEGIIINGKTYNSVKQLSQLFIESYGSKVPNEFDDSNNNINVEMFINNSAGEITLKITFKKLDGYPNSISFVQTFAGFSKGNDVATDDVLSFYDQNLLFTMHPEYKELKPSYVVEMLTDKDKIKDFFSSPPTGSYEKAIKNHEFELITVADDNIGKLIITIKFKKDAIYNKDSLLEYTVEYDGFDHY